MAEIPIQPKKRPLNPWLLVAVAVVALALAAYWFLRPDPADEPAPPVPVSTSALPVVPDTAALPTELKTAVADSGSARAHLLQLVPTLAALTDRPDLRDDATVREQRDNLTSATARLADGDARASLRPGLVALANLLRAVQQRAYPALDADAARLSQQADQLSGRDATAAEQQQNQQFLQAATTLLTAETAPTP